MALTAKNTRTARPAETAGGKRDRNRTALTVLSKGLLEMLRKMRKGL
jgi:hypothetical protein